MHAVEPIVFCDEKGRPTGEIGPKLASHTLTTKLHLAFSCYIFNREGQLLVTKRAATKKVWPSVWTNTVCGHPLPEEPLEEALLRRLNYELGMSAQDIRLALPAYRYTTKPYNGIIENEYCPVFLARTSSIPKANPEEVEEIKWLTWQDFLNSTTNDTETYEIKDKKPLWSWWCKDQIKQLSNLSWLSDYSSKVNKA